MAAPTIEERMTALETEVAQIKQQIRTDKPPEANIPWWKQRLGAFENDPLYEEAARLGREYREAQPFPDDEDEHVPS